MSEHEFISNSEFALVRVSLNASRQRWPIGLEVSSDGGKTWKYVPTGACTITNNAHGRPEVTWKHVLVPPFDDGSGIPQPLTTLVYSEDATNMIEKTDVE